MVKVSVAGWSNCLQNLVPRLLAFSALWFFGATPMLLGRPILEMLNAVVDFGGKRMHLLGGDWQEIRSGKGGAMLLKLADGVTQGSQLTEVQVDLISEDDDHDQVETLSSSLKDLHAENRFAQMTDVVRELMQPDATNPTWVTQPSKPKMMISLKQFLCRNMMWWSLKTYAINKVLKCVIKFQVWFTWPVTELVTKHPFFGKFTLETLERVAFRPKLQNLVLMLNVLVWMRAGILHFAHTPQRISPKDWLWWTCWDFHVPKVYVVEPHAEHQHQVCCRCRWSGRTPWNRPRNPFVHLMQSLLEASASWPTRSHWAPWEKSGLENKSVFNSSWVCCSVWSMRVWCHNNQQWWLFRANQEVHTNPNRQECNVQPHESPLPRWSHPLSTWRFHAWWRTTMQRSRKLWRKFGKVSGQSGHARRGSHSANLCGGWCRDGSHWVLELPSLPELRHQERCASCLSWQSWELQSSHSSWCHVDWVGQEEMCGYLIYGWWVYSTHGCLHCVWWEVPIFYQRIRTFPG